VVRHKPQTTAQTSGLKSWWLGAANSKTAKDIASPAVKQTADPNVNANSMPSGPIASPV
jgi:hypothetical protein